MSTLATIRYSATVGAAAVSALLLAIPAQAQQPLSRAEVQQQTIAAMQAGDMTPAGEGSPQSADAGLVSGKTREQRKAETMQARRNGEFPTNGLGLYRSNMSQQTATANSTKTRVERKTETIQAIKSHKMTPAGEAA